ncbi:MAG: hypothetical protein H0T73_08555 [Ardenticatenales bacterium]|nr:hypothetical protein [Ardenticatenales bacterium]
MTSTIRLWGSPDDVREAIEQLKRLAPILAQSEIYYGSSNTGEIWQFVTVGLPPGSVTDRELSIFARFLCAPSSSLDAWGRAVGNQALTPGVRAFLHALQHPQSGAGAGQAAD